MVHVLRTYFLQFQIQTLTKTTDNGNDNNNNIHDLKNSLNTRWRIDELFIQSSAMKTLSFNQTYTRGKEGTGDVFKLSSQLFLYKVYILNFIGFLVYPSKYNTVKYPWLDSSTLFSCKYSNDFDFILRMWTTSLENDYWGLKTLNYKPRKKSSSRTLG